ncbi:hypothetical protein [Verminephrobacter eiseniae]|uniref:hypothetical protein n=1 Tax=Verminephrobacter eiseniae TaxID=364317 RepID=UPI00223808F3|nr:hypothetical protein [Verminephrobacter eiseniae]MCW5236615.1 hypothetical protein [Verminephrobacter eiseniae]
MIKCIFIVMRGTIKLKRSAQTTPHNVSGIGEMRFDRLLHVLEGVHGDLALKTLAAHLADMGTSR